MPAITIAQAFRLAVQYHGSGDLAAAEAICRQILAAASGHAEAWHLLGVCLLSTGRHEEARECLAQAAALAPSVACMRCDLGVVHRFLGQHEEAVRCFERALQIDPEYAPAWTNLSDTLLRVGRLDEAISSGQRAVAAQPDLAEAHSNLGNALRDKGRLDEAIHHFLRALAINPQFIAAYNNLAHAYIEADRLDDAIASCDRALGRQPTFAKAWLNRGTAYMGKDEVGEAEQSFRRALACQPDYPDAHWNLGIALLLSGQYEDGWREFEWRHSSTVQKNLGGLAAGVSQPKWDGSPAEGATILVYAEQGIGDTIQFARYLPLVRAQARARRVLFRCPPSLAGLFAASGEWHAEIIPHATEDGSASLEFDQHIALPSLPLALRRFTPEPADHPYLQADADQRARWRDRLGSSSRTKVGLVWKGNPKHVDDRRRSLDPHLLSPLLRVPEVDFYSLQVTHPSIPAPLVSPEGVIDLTAHLTDFTETAACLAELDLLISVDTAAAHLAGALGRPVWTLLPFAPDWRWGLESESTPWYATMRLFRQKTAGAWEEVIERVAAELSAFRVARVP
ncbi:TPR repeat-containing protein [Chthoniobacter flavus Ellin428]|uniref:TPR repeat-containing protein n=1 Tax=Chthoniobacter flavus Ellin428 TaxID=497964 RepID=B4D8D4_9BACT|nr:tetratricopeptide repeat protein [Chthoniobacter flavus]EDY17327.1 TPR repeat-containing protein [Chthoniobacter flavus Ellin428]TCO90103.1 tetratricopeptide (TPR) repeat protein [Chthoniobacter flavus]